MTNKDGKTSDKKEIIDPLLNEPGYAAEVVSVCQRKGHHPGHRLHIRTERQLVRHVGELSAEYDGFHRDN